MKQKLYCKFEHYLSKNHSPVTGLPYKQYVMKVTERHLNRIWNDIQVLNIKTVMQMVDNQVKDGETNAEQREAIIKSLNGIHEFAINTNFDQTTVSNLKDVKVRQGDEQIACKQIVYSPRVLQSATPKDEAEYTAMFRNQGK